MPALASVLIPAFNASQFLAEAVASALAQTHRELEVLIVDDGSTDGTLALAQELARTDSRIRVLSQSNAGVGAARNRAIAEARGEFLAPLDADDFWYPEKLEKQIQALTERGPDWALAYCWSRSVDKLGNTTNPLPHWPVEGNILRALIYRNIIGNASVPLMRTKAVRELGGYRTREDQKGAQGCEDWDLALKLAGRYRAAAIPEFLVAYRQIHGTMTSNYSGMAASYELTMSSLRKRHPELPAKLFRWSAGHFYMYLLNTAYVAGNYPESFRLLRLLLSTDPATVFCPTIYRVLVISLLRQITGKETLRRTHPGEAAGKPPLTGWNPRRIFWIPAHLVEAHRWAEIQRRSTPL